jgi:hypothetical protein
MILIGLGRHMEALLELEHSLMVYKDHGSLLGIAQTLECFGCACMSRGDYEDESNERNNDQKKISNLSC